jgi:hypothetical protein
MSGCRVCHRRRATVMGRLREARNLLPPCPEVVVPRLSLHRAARCAVPLALAVLTALSVAAPATAVSQPVPQPEVALPTGLEPLPD